MSSKAYGDVFATNHAVEETDVGHISGGLLRYGPSHEPVAFEIHAGGPSQPQKVRLSFGDAMFLLSMLKSIQLDLGIPFPEDPRG